MSAPRLELNLDKIRHNARTLVRALARRGITVTGVTKATPRLPGVARALVGAGVCVLGDSRIENIESMRRDGVTATMALIRSPMLSQAERVVASADISFNTELEVIGALSRFARTAKRTHRIVLMVELGDLREGIMPAELEGIVRRALSLPNVAVHGIGANLACRSGVTPDDENMAELSALARSIETRLGLPLQIVSGGNSANIDWALGTRDVGRVNDLRLGESILLGREPLRRRPISGLHTDAITLVAEVIESKVKPSRPWGQIAQAAFAEQPPALDRGDVSQAILAVGHQDVDPAGLEPPDGIEILGASSDHVVVRSVTGELALGAELRFRLSYGALLRATTSPYVTKVVRTRALAPLAASAASDLEASTAP